MTAVEKQYTGREKTLVSLTFGKHRLKFFSSSSIQGTNYDKITTRRPWSILSVPLPVTLVTEVCRFYETANTALDQSQAEKLGENILTQQLQSMVEPYGTVSSTLCTSRRQGDVWEVTLAAECVEEIGTRVPIITEEPSNQRSEDFRSEEFGTKDQH
jgi:similar to stage IV sporulation protein